MWATRLGHGTAVDPLRNFFTREGAAIFDFDLA